MSKVSNSPFPLFSSTTLCLIYIYDAGGVQVHASVKLDSGCRSGPHSTHPRGHHADGGHHHHQMLESLKMATDMLRPGGWFISKVFRSKDYNAFLYACNQVWKRTKTSKVENMGLGALCMGLRLRSHCCCLVMVVA